MLTLHPKLLFGTVFIKKITEVKARQSQSNMGEQVMKVTYGTDGTESEMSPDEFHRNYEETDRPDVYVSRAQWKDIELVRPGTKYKTKTGAIKKAAFGILARETIPENPGPENDGNAFYEISPFHLIGSFTPTQSPGRGGKPDKKGQEILKSVYGRAKIIGPLSHSRDINALGGTASLLFKNTPYVFALAGYSDATDTYGKSCEQFLSHLIKSLGDNKIGFITSPTASPNSIDAISTILAQRHKIPILYVTAHEYLQYIQPHTFPRRINIAEYVQTLKFTFQKPTDYSVATAKASNVCLVIGGRNAAVGDAVNAMKQPENKIIIVDDHNLEEEAWDSAKERVNNASRYLWEQLSALREERTLPYPLVAGLTIELLKKARKEQRIRIIPIEKSGTTFKAAEARRRNRDIKQKLYGLNVFIRRAPRRGDDPFLELVV